MAQFANQNTLTIRKENVNTKATGKEPYLISYKRNLVGAMNELSGTAFKVYVFLLCNADAFQMDFSPAYIAREIGVHRDSVRKALKEFENKGFMSLLKNQSIYSGVCHYDFFEVRHPYLAKKPAEPRQDSAPEDGRGSYTWE